METDWLKRWNGYAPKSVAIKDAETGTAYSYADLYKLSRGLAAHMSSQFEIEKGMRVAVLATNELEYIPLFFAIQRLGAIMVPLNYRLTSREINHILQDSDPELLIFQEQFHETLEKVDARLVPEKKWLFDGRSEGATLRSLVTEVLGTPDTRVPLLEMDAGFDDPCKILYTSGTTGAPKGAIITHRMLFWNSINTTLRLDISQNDVSLAFLPFFHTGGWNVLLTPFLHRGARTILMRKFEAQRVLELCQSERVTILFGVPTTMGMMANCPEFKTADLTSVRYAIVGGEPMPVDLIKIWQGKNIPIRQGYGLTEFGPNVFSLNEEDSLRKIGSVGFPNFYIDVKIVDSNDREILDDAVGELWLKGQMCTPGYWNHQEATAETITTDGWFKTGDLVRRDSDGYFYVAGRKKEMFISGAENVYPVEIERFLSTHPKIREVAVVGIPDPKWGEVGRAFVTLNTGQSMTADDVLAFCEGNLAKYKIPRQIAFLADLPKGDSGKILKRKLAEMDVQT